MTGVEQSRPSVLLLAGGPDPERDVSREGAEEVASALRASDHAVHLEIIDAPEAGALATLPGDVVFPLLHGPWGEGGPLQSRLESMGKPFVGSKSAAASLAMDKLTSARFVEPVRSIAIPMKASLGKDADPASPPESLPLVLKPRREGSSVGLHFVRTPEQWESAIGTILAETERAPDREYIMEQAIEGRELTVGVLDGSPLPIVEIAPKDGIYDYQAKYDRDDTGYVVEPQLPTGMTESLQRQAVDICAVLGVRHLARVDILLDSDGIGWYLETNTMPGFTTHSLFPMAAAAAGLDLPALCRTLVDLAIRDA